MEQPVAILAVKLWRTEDGEFRARLTAKLDAIDGGAAEVTHYATASELQAAIFAVVRRYEGSQSPRLTRDGRREDGPGTS